MRFKLSTQIYAKLYKSRAQYVAPEMDKRAKQAALACTARSAHFSISSATPTLYSLRT